MKSDFFRENLAKNDLVAAPLAGISHLPFRRILRKFFTGIVYSEMMSVEGISRRNADSMEYLDRCESESPLVFQLFGGKPASFAEAVKVAENTVKVDAFDINMGCPVKKVLKAGGGCSILSDLPRLQEVVKAVRRSTEKPFSIKIRIGLESKNLIYRDILEIAEGEGVDAIVIHARTKADMFGGTVRLDTLADAVSVSKIPVIGNGGIVSPETYKEMKATGVAGVMIGRGMMKSPWIFESIRKGKEADGYLSPLEILSILKEFHGYMQEHAGERGNKRTHYMHTIRKFAVWFCKGMEEAVDFRTKLYQTHEESEVLALINGFFSTKTGFKF